MKKMKLAVVFAALVSVFGFSSCLNSDGDNNSSWDAADYVTVREYLGSAQLLTDNGLVLTPTSSSVLAGLVNGSKGYHPRALVYYKLAEGETFVEGKTSYTISQIVGGTVLPSKEFNTNPDTLKADYSITSFENNDFGKTIWAKNRYINIPFTTKATSKVSIDAFHLYATGVDGDTLFTRFHQDAGGENAYESKGALICYKLPLNSSLYSQLIPKEDSIVIKVIAKGENNTTLVKTAKYKWSER